VNGSPLSLFCENIYSPITKLVIASQVSIIYQPLLSA
jgi:hypothetical protein